MNKQDKLKEFYETEEDNLSLAGFFTSSGELHYKTTYPHVYNVISDETFEMLADIDDQIQHSEDRLEHIIMECKKSVILIKRVECFNEEKSDVLYMLIAAPPETSYGILYIKMGKLEKTLCG